MVKRRKTVSKRDAVLRAVREVDVALARAWRHPDVYQADLKTVLAIAHVMHCDNRLTVELK